MSTLSIFSIEGTIEPPRELMRCTDEARVPVEPPSLFKKISSFNWESCVAAAKYFDYSHSPKDPLFWTMRTIHFMLVAPHVVSFSRTPTYPQVETILFVQKLNQSRQIRGFHAPYLTEEDRRVWAVSDVPIFSQYALQESFADIPSQMHAEMAALLACFLADSQTRCITFTLTDGHGYLSRGWIKV